MLPIARLILLPLLASLALVWTRDAEAEEPVTPPKASDKDKVPAPAPSDKTSADAKPGETKPATPTTTAPKPAGSSLMDLDIESLTQVNVSLAQVKVVSVSKRVEKLSDAPAAIYSLGQDDIRRNGAQSIPEALRAVPGLSVARLDSGSYAISSRGLGSKYTNNLLVLNDGRSIYTPLFGGVFWENQPAIMENIARIEVIRGPGATLYGSNAVNGVINIITKSSKETQGWMASGHAGNQDNNGAVQYGGQIGEHAWFRVFGQYTELDDNVKPTFDINSGDPAKDEYRSVIGGARFDWEPSKDDRVTFQGDYHAVRYDEFLEAQTADGLNGFTGEDRDQEWYALGRWAHTMSETSGFSMQLYYDHTIYDQAGRDIERRDTIDFEFQYQFAVGDRHHFVAGVGDRFTNGTARPTRNSPLTFAPAADPNNIVSGFIQDEITLIEDKLKLTVGTKMEHNDYSGFEIQPSGRLAWTPTDKHTLWASVSRAARTPTQIERTLGLGGFLVANNDFKTAYLVAYEFGYRFIPSEKFSLDMTVFVNDYKSLGTNGPFDDTGRVQFQNKGYGQTMGGEISLVWNPVKIWRLQGSYTALRSDLQPNASESQEDNVPKHQFQAHSYLDLPHNVELDFGMYVVDRLPGLDVPSYVRFDAAVGWKPTKNYEIRLVGQNLNNDVHEEYGFSSGGVGSSNTQIERSVFLKAVLRF